MRRHLLEDLLPSGHNSKIRMSEAIEADPDHLFALACEHGLEGIVGKNLDSTYRAGRGGDWIKVKCIQSESFFIVGWQPSSSAIGGIGALLLGAYKGDEIVYVGSVGTGLKEATARPPCGFMDKLKTKKPSVTYDGDRKEVRWLQPTLIAEIEFRAWTGDGKLRHAAYKGLRERQDNADVFKVEISAS